MWENHYYFLCVKKRTQDIPRTFFPEFKILREGHFLYFAHVHMLQLLPACTDITDGISVFRTHSTLSPGINQPGLEANNLFPTVFKFIIDKIIPPLSHMHEWLYNDAFTFILGAFAKLQKANISLVMSLRTTRLPRDGFWCNFIFEVFSKLCAEISIFIKIQQE
jgi:hypothetical protein